MLKGGIFSTLRLAMGDKRYFQVESKSFEIVKHAFELCIIEHGRNHVSNVSMGFAAA